MKAVLRWILIASVLGASAAQAQQTVSDEAAATLDTEARQVFEAGRTAYAAGRYRNAYEYFAHAFELSHRSGLLFNMAQAADRGRMDAEALDAYRRFIEAQPDSTERVMIEQRIRDLSSGAPPREPEPLVPTTPPSGGGGIDPAPWIVVAIGGAAAITGGILLTLGLLDKSSVEGAPRDSTWDMVEGAYGRAPTFMITGDILLIAGAATAAFGVIWAIVAPGPRSNDTVSLGFGLGSLALRGQFDVAP